VRYCRNSACQRPRSLESDRTVSRTLSRCRHSAQRVDHVNRVPASALPVTLVYDAGRFFWTSTSPVPVDLRHFCSAVIRDIVTPLGWMYQRE